MPLEWVVLETVSHTPNQAKAYLYNPWHAIPLSQCIVLPPLILIRTAWLARKGTSTDQDGNKYFCQAQLKLQLHPHLKLRLALLSKSPTTHPHDRKSKPSPKLAP